MSRRSSSGSRRVSTEGSQLTGGNKGSTLKVSRMTSIYHKLGDGGYKVVDLGVDLANELILLTFAKGKKGGARDRIPIGLSVAEALELSAGLRRAAVKILEMRMYEG